MPYGTAAARLRKGIMFMLAQRCGMATCFRCAQTIEIVADFSIEHTQGWEKSSDPVSQFFNLDHIAFSHLRCNQEAAAAPSNKKYKDEPTRKLAKERRYRLGAAYKAKVVRRRLRRQQLKVH
jgi:uncharacterized protein YdaU (DUF1376 family)